MIRIRRELSQLRADNAAKVPPAVSARVTAALRSAPRPAVHTIARPKLSRAQSVGLLTGLGAEKLEICKYGVREGYLIERMLG